MPSFSEVQFTSFLVYPSKKAFPELKKYRETIKSIKNDKVLPDSRPPKPAVAYTAKAIRQAFAESDIVRACFSEELPRPPRTRGGRLVYGSGWSRDIGRIASISRSRGRFRPVPATGRALAFRSRISGAERNRHGSSRATERNPLELSRSLVDATAEVNARVALRSLVALLQDRSLVYFRPCDREALVLFGLERR